MELTTFYTIVGFLLAAYSVTANDSVQTLGTFISSNCNRVNWKWLWLAASSVLVFTLVYGWVTYGGDISYGRLDSIPFVEIQWYHAAAPLLLLALTYFGIPVSTSFLVLSVFASSIVLEKMVVKSAFGYAVAAISAYIIWYAITWAVRQWKIELHPTDRKIFWWSVAQWCTTGFLYWSWLSHDMANIAVFLPRQLSVEQLLMVMVVFIAGLGYIFYNKGGKIQKIVVEKTDTQYIIAATLIDFVYAVVLLIFKEYNNIPMSTTWVFVGLLAGRELAIHSFNDKKIGDVFPIIGRDFMKIMFGAALSLILVLIVLQLQG